MYPKQTDLQPEDAVRLVDTHCHLDCEPLRSDLPRILASARRAGVIGFVVPGVHPDDWGRITALSREHGGVMTAFGIHPMHADLAEDSALAALEKIAATGVALGEIGLDPLYSVPLERQERAFRDQLRLAVALGLPVLVHCRRCFERTLWILREEKAGQVGGIMHAFSGSPEMAREFIRLGFCISLSGTVTWQGALRPVRLAREIPLENLVLETDAPDLTPQAHRGQPNQPAWMWEVLLEVADIRGMLVADVAHAVLNNTQRIFGDIPAQ
ncbi:MAG: TatD family hydrolase [Desulfuromonadales bacterium]|nr:TatD family hydrolase [Desulfuromonadales bacterium]